MQLATKQLLTLIPATLLVAAMALFAVADAHRQTIAAEFDTRSQAILDTAAAALAVPLAGNDETSVEAIASEIAGRRDIRCVAVTAADGRQWGRGGFPCGTGLTYLSRTLSHKGNHIGSIELWTARDDTEAELARHMRNEFALVAALCFLVAGAGFAVQTFFVRRPLVRLLDAIRASEKDGQLHQVEWQSSDELGKVAAAYNDAVSRINRRHEDSRRTAEELWKLANHDPLTGLWNRRYFLARVDEEFAYGDRQGEPLALLMLDIDHFKRINDTHGHDFGDEVLRQLSVILNEELRTEDVCARYGGEEFVILLRATNGSRAAEMAERIRARAESAVVLCGEKEVRFTLSIGVVDIQALPERTLTRALSTADRALYRAKNSGRNRVVVGGSETDGRLTMRLVWNAEFVSSHAQIDAEHETLIARINELAGKMQQRADPAAMSDEFATLLDLLEAHCRTEERVLGAIRWPHLKEHAGLHGRLMRRGRQLQQRFAADATCVGDVLDYLVREVIGDHLAHEDSRYFSSLTMQSKESPASQA